MDGFVKELSGLDDRDVVFLLLLKSLFKGERSEEPVFEEPVFVVPDDFTIVIVRDKDAFWN